MTILPHILQTTPHCVHSQVATTSAPSDPGLSSKITELEGLVKVLVTQSGAASQAESAAQQAQRAQHAQQGLMLEVQRQLGALQQGQGLLVEQLQAQAQQSEHQQRQLEVCMNCMR